MAKDVADILGYAKPGKMYERLDEDEKLTLQIGASGQMREMTIINESGLYNAILGSQKPDAKRFKKWIKSEVLPDIRRHRCRGKQKSSLSRPPSQKTPS